MGHKHMRERAYHLVSIVCSATEYAACIPQEKHRTAYAAQKYLSVFCDGFVRNEKPIKVFCKRPTTKAKSGRTYIPAADETVAGIAYHYIRSIHLPVVGNIYAALSAFCYYLNPAHCKRQDVVFLDPLTVSLNAGAALACKLRGIPTVALVTDLPDCYAYADRIAKVPLFAKISNWIRTSADALVLLTEQMNTVCNPKHRPYIVLEGFSHEGMRDLHVDLAEKYDHPVCMYTGGIEAIYGLDMLVEGFIKADIPNSELHLYGTGSYVKDILQHAKTDARIRYFGTRENSYVVREQMKATLLINPRYTDSEFTQYSFPSKNMEYAASGTPLLTTALPGMPKEYDEHVFILQEETVDGMANALRSLCAVDPAKLYAHGQQTKQWVLDNKSNRVQIEKIIAFTDKLFDKTV